MPPVKNNILFAIYILKLNRIPDLLINHSLAAEEEDEEASSVFDRSAVNYLHDIVLCRATLLEESAPGEEDSGDGDARGLTG